SKKDRGDLSAPPIPANNEAVASTGKDRGRLFHIGLVLLGAVIGAALTPVGEEVFRSLREWYLGPDISIWYSYSQVGLSGERDTGATRNSIYVIDRSHNCAVVTLQGVGHDPAWKPWISSVESVFTVFLENKGRSPVTDVKIALLGEHLENVEVIYSPELAGEVKQSEGPTQRDQVIVLLRLLRPRTQVILMF